MRKAAAGYTIGQVSDLLGVPAPTIRSWERRYGLGPRSHTGAGHRRYHSEDLSGLQRMRDELARGRGAAEAAAMVRSLPSATPALLVQTICAAAQRLDDRAIVDALEQARTLHGLAAAVDLVLLPAMRELGRRWADEECDVAHEHLATAAAQNWLKNAAPALAPDPLSSPVLLACAPDEQHTLPLDALAVLLAHAGLRCLNLGARVPPTSLRRAAQDSEARAVVLACQVTSQRRSAVAALQEAGNTRATAYYAGGAFTAATARRHVPGRYLGANLEQATRQIVASTAELAPSLR